jgi:hypothetical protein
LDTLGDVGDEKPGKTQMKTSRAHCESPSVENVTTAYIVDKSPKNLFNKMWCDDQSKINDNKVVY